MLIVCPTCATSYQVEPSSLGTTGRSVRCVRCRKVWFAANTEPMAAIALAHRRDLAAAASAASQTNVLAAEAASEPPVEDTTPVAAEAPVESPMPTAPDLLRDDRGPAPRLEPRDRALPAEPAVIDDAPALAPGDQQGIPTATIDTVPENVESVAARRIRRPPARRRSRQPVAGWAVVILTLIGINAGLVGWRTDAVRLLPQTAAIYAAIGLDVNLLDLVFTELVTRKETEDGAAMLVVEGVIKSLGRLPTDVPRLRLAVRNGKGQEIYNWTALPERNVIAPGETMPFRARLASPPPEAHAVLVRFLNRRDLAAGPQ